MSEAFFVSKAFFENAFEKIKRFRKKTIVRKNDTGSTPFKPRAHAVIF